MAKQDYSKAVGMWAVQPGTGATADAIVDTFVPHFEKIWDGHSCPPKRACNVVMSYIDWQSYGYPQQVPGLGTQPRSTQQAYTCGEWILRIKEANASTAGAGAPRSLSGIVFRAMWNLTYVNTTNPLENNWTPCEIQSMASTFLDYFDGNGSPFPENKGSQLTNSDLPLLKGWLLADDFTRQPYNCNWDQIVSGVHSTQQGHSVNRPFYFTNQVFADAIWDNSKPYGQRLNGLKTWLNVFNSTGATPVFMPQYYPWLPGSTGDTQWDYHDGRHPYIWWDVALDELLYLKNNGYPSLRVQPVIQAYAQTKAGPGHPDIHNQLRSVLDHGVVDGVWVIGWNFPITNGRMVYPPNDNHWTAKEHIAEAIQVEVGAGGAGEVIVTSVPASGMSGSEPAFPQGFNAQPGSRQGPGGVRLKFNLANRQPIHIQVAGPSPRNLIKDFVWSGRTYSYDGPWNKAQYTREPKKGIDDASLNPLHGTSVNWNGWNASDTAKATSGDYGICLKDSNTGGTLGNPVSVKLN